MTNELELHEYTPTISDKIKYKIESWKYSITNRIETYFMQKRINRFKKENSNYYQHFCREMKAIGYDLNETKDNPNKWIQENVMELLYIFGTQGHSGSSAPFCISYFEKLAKFEPLCPLTGKDEEWVLVSPNMYQNKRCSHVFKNESGLAYDIHGYIFKNQNGSCYSGNYSKRKIEFPYKPKTEYVDVRDWEVDKDTNEPKVGTGWWETEYPQFVIDEYETNFGKKNES